MTAVVVPAATSQWVLVGGMPSLVVAWLVDPDAITPPVPIDGFGPVPSDDGHVVYPSERAARAAATAWTDRGIVRASATPR